MIVNVSQRVLLNSWDVIRFLLGSDGTETHWNAYYCAVASWWAIVFFSFLAERSCSVTGWRLSTIVIRCNHKHVNLRDSRRSATVVCNWCTLQQCIIMSPVIAMVAGQTLWDCKPSSLEGGSHGASWYDWFGHFYLFWICNNRIVPKLVRRPGRFAPNQSSQQKTNLVNLTKTTSRLSWVSGATEFRGKLAWKLMHLRFLATFGMAAKNMFDYNRTWAGPFEEFLVRQNHLIVETWSHSSWGMVDSWFSAYIGPNTNLKESGW